ncbi:L,D-transpeptidase [[Phormidium] sp. ETS-05]|uniref:L,D-transpeptidase n=1 Tax=[Phormidium] sp. ETS-05 TaxID=222819 RepID=UPI0018EED4A4|nr:L,D-transpeptidase [[Phormidium] sp. ETS-05]
MVGYLDLMFTRLVTLTKWLVLAAIAGCLSFSYQPCLHAETESQVTLSPKIPEQLERLEVSLSRRTVTLHLGLAQPKIYPVAIGKSGWETPTGNFQITQMVRNPVWINPLTDEVIPSGDLANPLGSYWIGFWTEGWIWYGFHGTNEPESIGKAITHGCLRMYNKDVEELFSQVSLGTVVTIRE